DQSALLKARVLVPTAAQAQALGSYILVDASGSDESAWVRDGLLLAYDTMEVAEPNHRLLVFRFSSQSRSGTQ
ncbi:MAG TPA: hypothetical protein PKY96_01410, partial [Flavobacteriales bacterium]|nr:hypothetical protein [Flavobacteriales bacterium]